MRKMMTIFAAIAGLVALDAGADVVSTGSPLDDLLSTPISTAAKYGQTMDDVAASVTVITAEEISRYGWRTLSDVLGSVRSFYTTYDRAYTYVGVRGVGLPGDYNNRFLVLLNGQPLVECVFGYIDAGTALAIDMSALDRIEFVRGPGSVMYGTGAMFGVINLITKNEAERSAMEVSAGSNGSWAGAGRGGFVKGELRAGAALSWREDNGHDHYYPEFDAPETNGGISHDRDYDDSYSFMTTARWRGVELLALHNKRTKGIPTASWGTAFGRDDRNSDERTLWSASFKHQLSPASQISARAFYDIYRFAAVLPTETFDSTESSDSHRLGGELRHVWDARPNHRVTSGVTYATNRGGYRWNYSGDVGETHAAFREVGGFLQADSDLHPRVSTTLGVSYGYRSGAGFQLMPRAAVILRPAKGSTVKLLYGAAFRTPSSYELDYETNSFLRSSAGAERIRTTEVVVEQRLGASVLASLSVFKNRIDHLIQLEPVGDDLYQFQNSGAAQAHGAELQLDYRRNDGLWSYISYSNQVAQSGGEQMLNSPRNLVKAGVSTATANRIYGGLEAQYESSRTTLAGAQTDPVGVANLNLGFRIVGRTVVTLSVRNAFDARYGQPADAGHLQDTIAQDGRRYVFGVRMGGR